MSYLRPNIAQLLSRGTTPVRRGTPMVAIRPARDADLPALYDLAELDAARPLHGPVLVALVDGVLWAALSLHDGRAIADPFKPSAGAAELLRMRAAQLAETERATCQRTKRLPTLLRRARV